LHSLPLFSLSLSLSLSFTSSDQYPPEYLVTCLVRVSGYLERESHRKSEGPAGRNSPWSIRPGTRHAQTSIFPRWIFRAKRDSRLVAHNMPCHVLGSSPPEPKLTLLKLITGRTKRAHGQRSPCRQMIEERLDSCSSLLLVIAR
jgi:hypothetical protein